MSELSHEGAYRLIYQGHISEAERRALRSHLRTCAACRRQTAVDSALHRSLVLEMSPVRPSPQFTAVFMESAARRSRRSQIMKPAYAVGALAALALIVLAGWFIIRGNPETTSLEAVDVAAPAVRDTPEVDAVERAVDEQLIKAVMAENSTAVEQLLDAGANPDTVDSKGNALLAMAAKGGQLDVVRLLLHAGADVNATNTDSGATNETGLGQAAANNHIEVVKLLIAHGADVNQAEETYKRTPLHGAAWYNNAEIVKILLENGADPNLPNAFYDGETPLHYAARNGSIEAVQALLDGGADVDNQTDVGMTPMMSADVLGNSEMVTLLLEGGANPDLQDIYGNPALHAAAHESLRNESIPTLIEHGASIDLQNNVGNSALHHAAQWNNAGAVAILIELGASLDLKNNQGQTALDVTDSDKIIEMLREAGAGE